MTTTLTPTASPRRVVRQVAPRPDGATILGAIDSTGRRVAEATVPAGVDLMEVAAVLEVLLDTVDPEPASLARSALALVRGAAPLDGSLPTGRTRRRRAPRLTLVRGEKDGPPLPARRRTLRPEP